MHAHCTCKILLCVPYFLLFSDRIGMIKGLPVLPACFSSNCSRTQKSRSVRRTPGRTAERRTLRLENSRRCWISSKRKNSSVSIWDETTLLEFSIQPLRLSANVEKSGGRLKQRSIVSRNALNAWSCRFWSFRFLKINTGLIVYKGCAITYVIHSQRVRLALLPFLSPHASVPGTFPPFVVQHLDLAFFLQL